MAAGGEGAWYLCVVLRRLFGFHRLPAPGFPIIRGFWRCSRCGSLFGGNKGKGPTQRRWAAGARWCRHRWETLDEAAFERALGEATYR